MENLNVLKESLAEVAVTAAVLTQSIDVTWCGGLSFQVGVTDAAGLSGVSVSIQKSLDNVNWITEGSATNITADGNFFLAATQPLGGNFYRLSFAWTAGTYTLNVLVLGKTFGGTSSSSSGGGGGSGTVTSVAMTVPSTLLAVSGSPVTSSGTLAVTLPTRAANIVFSGPVTGAAAAPAFRALVSDDIPNLAASKITSGTLAVANGGTNLASYTAGNLLYATGATTLAKLAIGTAAQVLKVNAGATAPEWATGGAGDVVGPSASLQYQLAYYEDTSGKLLENAAAITAARALISDANGLPTHATTTATEIGYVNGVTSAIQTQINTKVTAVSSTDNAIVRFDSTAGAVQNSAVTVADTTGAMLWPVAAAHQSIYVPSTTALTTNGHRYVELVGSLQPAGSATVLGMFMNMSTGGSNSSTVIIGERINLTSGYTGTGLTAGLQFNNSVAGTGTDIWNSSFNAGIVGQASATTVGHNVGGAFYVAGGKRGYGVVVGLDATPNGGSGQNAGLFASVHPGNGTTDVTAAVYGVLSTTALKDLPSATIAAGAFNNGSTTFAPLIAQDAGVTCFSVADGGACTLGAASTTPTHRINTASTAAGSDAMTLLNGPAGTAGNPDVFITININGTAHVIPAWIP